MDGLEPVADVRQGATHDNRHRVVEIRGFHFFFYRNGDELSLG